MPKKLEPEERQIIQAKYKSERFCVMAPEDVDLWADALMLKINAITGWTIPASVALTVFSDQLKKKLTESYANVNPDEIEYAFRNYGTVVKDWGKSMNLSLLDQVMIPYLERRLELSKFEEQQEPVVEKNENKEDMSDLAMADWYNETYKKVKAGECTVDFIPIMLYEWKDTKGEIKVTSKQKHEYLAKAADHRYNFLLAESKDKPSTDSKRAVEAFSVMHKEWCFVGKEIDMLKNLAKRMILYDIIKEHIDVC